MRQNVGGWQSKHPGRTERYCWRSLMLGSLALTEQKEKSDSEPKRINDFLRAYLLD
jgi:hypothetical protein